MKKTIYISFDTGFSGGKIVINKHIIYIPFMYKNDTGAVRIGASLPTNPDYVRFFGDGEEYIIGKYAQVNAAGDKYNSTNKVSLDRFYTMDRFEMREFEVVLKAIIGYSLIQYEEITKNDKEPFRITELKDYKLVVGIALPHSENETRWEGGVREVLCKEHNFELYVGGYGKVSFRIKLDYNEVFHNSQAYCVYFCQFVDDEGYENEEAEDLKPILFIDCGYRTVGTYVLDNDDSVKQAESDTTYAMMNVNESVAEKLRDKDPSITAIRVESIINTQKGKMKYLDTADGKVKEENIMDLWTEEVRKKADELVCYLAKQHNNFIDINSIVVAGGTGNHYYPHIKEWENKKFESLKNKIILANKGFNGEEIDPVYAVAVGLYRNMVIEFERDEH